MNRTEILSTAIAAAEKASGIPLVPPEIAGATYRLAIESRSTVKESRLPHMLGQKIAELKEPENPNAIPHSLFLDWPDNVRVYLTTFIGMVTALEPMAEGEFPEPPTASRG